MKNLPDKIYIQPDAHDRWFEGNKPNDNFVEYVSKDAFIEKSSVKLKKLMYDNLMFQGRLHREEVINNFVEDFKNYIKGE